MHFTRRVLLWGAICLFFFTRSAKAANRPSKALILAIDVSGSVDSRRYRIQMDGYIEALQSEEIVSAIESSPGGIDVLALDWATYQWIRVPWTRLRTRADVVGFCKAFAFYARPTPSGCDPNFETESRANDEPKPPQVKKLFQSITRMSSYTFIGGAIATGTSLFLPEHTGVEKIIDISGDGPENVSAEILVAARAEALKNGITINGLPIIDPSVCYRQGDLLKHYRERVIGGEGAFVEPSNGFDDFKRAIRMKLRREIS